MEKVENEESTICVTEEIEHMDKINTHIDWEMAKDQKKSTKKEGISIAERLAHVAKMKERLAELTEMEEEADKVFFKKRQEWEEKVDKYEKDKRRCIRKIAKIKTLGEKRSAGEYGVMTREDVTVLHWA